MANKTRVTISTSEPAKKLFEYAKRLDYAGMVRLDRMLRNRVRLIVFHIDGDRVSLAEVEPASELVAA